MHCDSERLQHACGRNWLGRQENSKDMGRPDHTVH